MFNMYNGNSINKLALSLVTPEKPLYIAGEVGFFYWRTENERTND